MLRAMFGETIGGITLVELALAFAFATGLTLYNLLGVIANRILIDDGVAMMPTRTWLGLPLLTFVACAALLALAMYLRVRILGTQDSAEEPARA